MNKQVKHRSILIGSILSTIVLLSFLISFSYFTVTNRNNKNEEVSIETGNLSLVFSDGSKSFQGTLDFGSSAEKTFTIENNGSINGVVNVYWENIINTYLEDSLTYTFSYSETEDGEYKEIVTNKNVPISEAEAQIPLADSINIPPKTKYYYKLLITLNYLDGVDQTSDLKAMLSTEFTIIEATKKATITFDAGEGVSEVTSKEVALNSSYGELPTPVRVGYIFQGWYTESTGGIEITSLSIMNTLEAKTLYARWEDDKPESEKILAKLNITPKSTTGLDFSKPSPPTSGTDDTGVYSLEDDYGTSYFFRGNITNNYVKFGTWKEDIVWGYDGYNYNAKVFSSMKSCVDDGYDPCISLQGKPMYWRVIRVNGDGSLRIQYDRTKTYPNGEMARTEYQSDRLAILSQNFNSLNRDAKYVGYMYGPADTKVGTITSSTNKEQAQSNIASSDIKIALENWYKNNLLDMDSYISDTIFCYDRSIAGPHIEGWTAEAGPGYGSISLTTHYGAMARTEYDSEIKANPQFKCPNKNDAFTKSDISKGNGKLSQKVGLITADEVLASGSGSYGNVNTKYFLYKGGITWYWTGTAGYYSSYSGSQNFIVEKDGDLENYIVSGGNYDGGGTAPVINLSSEFVNTMIGDGSSTSPYRAPGLEP